MTMKLAFGKTLLDAGKTLVVPAGLRATIRVHDGVVWATSAGNRDDVWLSAGEEHTLPRRGVTVIESTRRSTIEFIPSSANDVASKRPSLKWATLPTWLDDIGALVALVVFVGLMAVAGYSVATGAEIPQSVLDAQRPHTPGLPLTTASQRQAAATPRG